MTTKNNSRVHLTKPSDRELVITREFDAPRRLVFEAMTQPEHMPHWYGPRNLKMIVCEIDFRPGGAWRFVVQSADGTEYGFSGVYQEIVPHERIVTTESYEAMPDHDYLSTMCFEEHQGKTVFTNTMRYKTMEDRDGHLASDIESGMVESFERLDEHLDEMTRQIVSTRVFDAPRDLLFKMWTEPQHLVQWWGPKGFTNTFHEFDFKPGGYWRFIMHSPDGKDFQNESLFEEIITPERIVFQHVSPPKFRTTVTFEAQGNKTKITWCMLFETAAAYDAVKGYAVPGNEQNFDKLEAHLAKQNLALRYEPTHSI